MRLPDSRHVKPAEPPRPGQALAQLLTTLRMGAPAQLRAETVWRTLLGRGQMHQRGQLQELHPPDTKGKGKGKAKGMSNRELEEQYRERVARVNEYVDKTGRGRRADGTWGASAHAAMGAMWLTAPEYRARGQCGHCGWQSSELWRCAFCHAELCMWHARWEGRVCHCSEGCRQRGRVG